MNNSMTDHTDIERIVMRRVHHIRILKFVVSTGIFAALALIAALWGVGREVWVAHVFENAPIDPAKLVGFYFAAFAHTRVIVQVLVGLTVASVALLAREIVRLLRNLFASRPS